MGRLVSGERRDAATARTVRTDTAGPRFDYIVVGAGSAGCVLADRLSRRSDHLGFSLPYRLRGTRGINRQFHGPGLWRNLARYYLTRAGPLASGPFEVGAFIRTRPEVPRADAQLYMGGFTFEVKSGALGTRGGPATDADARVLDVDGKAIAGRYADGNVMASPMGMTYGGAGGTLAPAMVFGFHAGRRAALTAA